MNSTQKSGAMEKIARRGTVVASVLALALAMAGASLAQAQSKANASKPAAAAATTTAPAAKSAPKGQFEGIKVHGHWTIEVRNPDGTVASHREFENSLNTTDQFNGPMLLGNLLMGSVVPGGYGISLVLASAPPGYAGGTIFLISPTFPNFCGGPSCNATLNYAPSAGGFTLSGQYVLNATPAGTYTTQGVGTFLIVCGNSPGGVSGVSSVPIYVGPASCTGSLPHSTGLDQVTVAAPGTTYSVGDMVTALTGTGGTVQVTAVNGTGGVTAVSVVNPGTDYTAATTVATTGSTGSGLTLNIMSVIRTQLTNLYQLTAAPNITTASAGQTIAVSVAISFQ